MNAFGEAWAAVIGWLDLIASRAAAKEKFNLTRAGLINAIGCYFAGVLLIIVFAILTGQPATLAQVIVDLIGYAVPLGTLLLVCWLSAAVLRPVGGALTLLVPAVYALAFILLLRLPLVLLAQDLFLNALLGALGFMLYKGARGVARFGIGSSLAFAVLCIVLLVVSSLGLYMLSTTGQGNG